MMTPKAVFWDMDGTLIDSEPLHERSLVAALRGLGIEPPDDLRAKVLGVAAPPVYQMLVVDNGLDIPFDEWIVRKYAHYMDHVGTLLPREGAVEIWRELEALGVSQAVVSNSDRLVVNANMTVIGINRQAIRSISRNDLRHPKPDPEAYLRAAYLVDVDPADCVVVEDSVPGATAGVEAGMRTLLWTQDPVSPPIGAILVLTEDELRYHLGLQGQA